MPECTFYPAQKTMYSIVTAWTNGEKSKTVVQSADNKSQQQTERHQQLYNSQTKTYKQLLYSQTKTYPYDNCYTYFINS
jgi:hypothetical protein